MDHGQDYLYPKVRNRNVGVDLSYKEAGSDQDFREFISTKPYIQYPCPSHPPLTEPATSTKGRAVCIVEGIDGSTSIGVQFTASEMMYQLLLTAGVPQSPRAAFLLALVDKLR